METVKRFEEKALERKERLNLIFDYAETIEAFMSKENKKMDLLIRQSDLIIKGHSQGTGNLELF